MYQPENVLLIENHSDGVVVRAAVDNLSREQKARLICYLAAEGYIPERYQWIGDPQEQLLGGLNWRVDGSWLANVSGNDSVRTVQALRVILYGFLLWLGVVVAVWMAHGRC